VKQKAVDKQAARIRSVYQWWKSHLGLEDWDIAIFYYDRPWKKAGAKRSKTHGVIADATVDWEYKRATLRFNVKETKGMADRKLEHIVVHELMHVKLNEMRHFGANDGMYHEERTATELGNAFLWVRYAEPTA
jgi:hypothetical protein